MNALGSERVTVISVAFVMPLGAVPGCAGQTPTGPGALDVSVLELAPVSLLATLVLPDDSEVAADEEPPEPPLEPLAAVVFDVELLPDAPVVVAGALEPVVWLVEDGPVVAVLDAPVVLLVPLAEDVALLVAVLFDPEVMVSTGPAPSVPLPQATIPALTKHKPPNLPKIVFMIIPSQQFRATQASQI